MTVPLAVFFTERAPVARAQWLQKLLEPVAAACLMQQAPPLEVRQTGAAGGWADNAKLAPDRRVCISSKIVFYHAEAIKYVYLHESSHRLLESREIDHHGPEFFCLLAILLARSSTFFAASSWDKLDLYDLQDRPEALDDADESWRGIVLNWSLTTAAELASGDAAAEALADVVCERWQSFLIERESSTAAAAKAAAGACQQRKKHLQQLQELKDSLTLWRWLGGLGWMFFVGLVWLNVRGFG